jgi:hypothetical protein
MTVAERFIETPLLTDSPHEDEYGNFSTISPPNHDHDMVVEGTLSRIFHGHVVLVTIKDHAHQMVATFSAFPFLHEKFVDTH